MNLFSILIADVRDDKQEDTQDDKQANEQANEQADAIAALPAPIVRNIASLRAHHPGLPHRLYDGPAIRAFLRTHMEADVLWAYDHLLPYAYRADLARLCLLHEFGGVYADLSVFLHAPLPIETGKLVVFRDRAVVAPWIVSNTLIGAPARMPVFEAAIRMIVAHCRSRYRGASALCPTGPVLFGRALALHAEPQQIHLGEVLNVAQRDHTESLVFVDATDGRMIAYRTKTAAGLQGLGLHRGVNNYNDFYRAQLIYAADYPIMIAAAYLHRHGRTTGAMDGAHLVVQDRRGDGVAAAVALCPLPFPFAAGQYRVLLDIAGADVDDGRGAATTGLVATAAGGATLAHTVQPIRPGAATVALMLDIGASRNDVILGILAGGGARLRIGGLRIERVQHVSVPELAP
jgi:hypothetical protein